MISRFSATNTFSMAALIEMQIWANENLLNTVENIYLKDVTIPEYSASDESHVIIPDEAPWNATTLNSTTWKHFYVRAGDYTGKPIVNTSGTITEPKTITLYDGLDTHPARLGSANEARIAIEFNDAEYWDVSRMSGNPALVYVNWSVVGLYEIGRGCSYITLDKIHFKECWSPISIRKNCYNNTIQKCYFDGVNSGMVDLDHAFIQLQDDAVENEYAETHTTRIILNDFKNYKPLRLQCKATTPWAKDFAGTIVDSNVAWFDSTTYVDSDGTPNVDGIWCNIEAGWGGVKAGSNDVNNPVLFSNNYITGAKPTYPDAPVNLSSPAASFATVYFYSKYINQFGNIIDDMAGGMILTSNTGSRECFYSRVEKNILHECGGQPEHNELQTRPIRFETTDNCTVRENIIKDGVGKWARLHSLNSYGNYFGYNQVINTDFAMIEISSSTVDGYATNTSLTTAEGNAIYQYDYTITYERYTDLPKTKVIENVLSMEQDAFITSIWNM